MNISLSFDKTFLIAYFSVLQDLVSVPQKMLSCPLLVTWMIFDVASKINQRLLLAMLEEWDHTRSLHQKAIKHLFAIATV